MMMMRKLLSLRPCFSFSITCQMTFDSLILLPSPLKVLKCSCATIEVFYEFSCVFRDVVSLLSDEICYNHAQLKLTEWVKHRNCIVSDMRQ